MFSFKFAFSNDSNNSNIAVSLVNFVVILRWYSKNEIPGVVLQPWQLKIGQFSSDILKFSIKDVVNPLTLKC